MPHANNYPHFLSVARTMALLTTRQIEEILYEQRRLRLVGVIQKVGPIAENLGYLSPQEAERVEQKREEWSHNGHSVQDEVKPRYRVWLLTTQAKNRLGLAGALATVIILVVVFIATGSWNAVGLAASLVSLAWVVVPQFLFGARLTVSGWLRWISGPIAVLISLALSFAAPGLPGWWYVILFTLPLIVILETCAGFWRNFKLETSDLRSCLMRCLAKSFRDSYIAVKKGEKLEDSAIEEILQWTARIVYLNPWNRLLRYFVPDVIGHPGVTSLWLFQPSSLGSDIEFGVRNYVVMGPDRTVDVFKRFQGKYHPRLNSDQLAHNQVQLRKKHLDPESEFLRESFRVLAAEYLSLPGLVFHHGRGFDGEDASKFWGFEEVYYRTAIEAEVGTHQALLRDTQWRAFAAYPVYCGGPQREGAPVGVLAAFSNTVNGLTLRDRNALVSAARLVGVLLDQKADQTNLP